MKYVRIISEATEQQGNYGILEDDLITIIEGTPLSEKIVRTDKTLNIKDVKVFLPPINAPSIIALGLNYILHAKESDFSIPTAPVIFIKAITSLTGHKQPILLPKEAPDFVDYEAELVIVIGKKAKHISKNEVKNYILGYTCGNDVSARDCQKKLDKQWARGKSFDTFAPIGPYIVTDIEPDNLEIETRLNGIIMLKSNTSELIFDIPEIVSYLSRQMTLLPGTLIMTGTPSGVGVARTPQVFLRQGDIVEVDIKGVGILENKVELEK